MIPKTTDDDSREIAQQNFDKVSQAVGKVNANLFILTPKTHLHACNMRRNVETRICRYGDSGVSVCVCVYTNSLAVILNI